MKKVLFVLFAGLFVFTACETDDDEAPNNNTDSGNGGAIESTDFVPTNAAEFKAVIDGESERTWDAGAFTLAGQTTFTSCRLDDTMEFSADGTYIYDGGMNLCGAEDNQQTRTGTWAIDFEAQTIIFDAGTSNEVVALVIGLSDNEMRLQGSYMMMEVRGLYASN